MNAAALLLAVALVTPSLARLLEAWEARRSGAAEQDIAAKAEAIRAYQFEAQRRCTADPSRLVAARCTRRSGKSSGWLREMVATALETPSSRQIYISTTRPEAEAVAWIGTGRDGLLSLNRDYDCGAVANMSKLRLTFPNQATIDLVGADDLRQINRLRGRAFHRVVIEEAQKAPHLEYTVREVLQPALADYGGQVAMIGTPSKECVGLFYEVTREDRDSRHDQWAAHHWSVLDNPRFGATAEERYEKTLASVLRQNHWTGDEPEFRREWLGLWVREDAYYVYEVHRVPDHELTWDAPPLPPLDGPHRIPTRDEMMEFLPRGEQRDSVKEWIAIVGIDLGYMDPFAYHLWVFSHEDPCLYEIASWKRSGLSFDEQGAIMRALADEWSPITMPTDAGGHAVKSSIKGWREGWLERKPLPVEEAHKTDKQTAIGWFNADLRGRKIKFRRGSHTLAEMKRLQWQVNVVGEIVGEHKVTPNHCSDAALYGHRHARHYLHTEPAREPERGTAAWYDAEEQRIRDRLREDLENGREGPYGGWQ